MAEHASAGISEIFRQYTGLDEATPESVQTKPEGASDSPDAHEQGAQLSEGTPPFDQVVAAQQEQTDKVLAEKDADKADDSDETKTEDKPAADEKSDEDKAPAKKAPAKKTAAKKKG